MKKIAYFSTSRSDYGPSYWLLHELARSNDLDLLLVLAGSHFDPRQGRSVDEVERDGLPVARTIPAYANGDDALSYATAAAQLLTGAAAFLTETSPDVAVLYGDRLELLPIATAAVATRTPIAHVCGGDVTFGALDEQVRHAATKMAHLHFPSNATAARRLLHMGEEPWRVHCVGDPALDAFLHGSFPDRSQLARELEFEPDQRTLLLTLHPETTTESSDDLLNAVTAMMTRHDGWIIVTGPAPDPGSARIREAMLDLAARRPRTIYREHLGAARYRGLMRLVGAVVGNSSSGLIEAGAVPVPAVNSGRRQEGRERSRNVIDCAADAGDIVAAVERALDTEFRASLAGMVNAYGDGHSAARIVAALRDAPPREALLRKIFCDS